MKDNSVMVDIVEILVKDKNGKVKAKYTINQGFWHKVKNYILRKHNSITQYGMAAMAFLACNGTATVPTFAYMNIGTGTTAANVTDFELKAECLTARVTATTGTSSTTYNSDTATWVQTFASSIQSALTGTSTVCEVGIFNAAASLAASNATNIMLLRQVWAGDTLNWAQGDSIQITVKCQMKQGA